MLKSLGFFVLLLSMVSLVFGNSVVCEYRAGPCDTASELVFYASDELSAHTRSNSESDSGAYGYSLCCSSPYSDLNFTTVSAAGACEGQEVMYFTDSTNSRVAFDYNPDHHQYKLCAEYSERFSKLDIKINESFDYGRVGYTCMYKMSSKTNSHVSSCDAQYNGDDSYEYTVWARLFENINSLQCNNDCTSKLDGRVYSACSQKISACQDVPAACDGSLIGGWVNDPDDPDRELQCSPSWSKTRSKVFTGDDIMVEGDVANCPNVINKKFTVMIDNEPVNMLVYVCSK